MDISVIGASGDCGREIVGQLLSQQVLAVTERLQLVGRHNLASQSRLFGFSFDLQDAYAERCPVLDVATDAADVLGDIVIMAAGTTIAKDVCPTRELLAQCNAPVFAHYAQALAQHGLGHELVIVVSNPVELGVQIFAEHLGRHRVVGMGAYSDSLRFRLELARDLHLRRQRIQAMMLGEHGNNQVPVWSQVQVFGLEPTEEAALRHRFLQGRQLTQFHTDVTKYQQALLKQLTQSPSLSAVDDGTQQALALLNSLPPDMRAVLRPYITHWSGAKTANATAHATVELVKELAGGYDKVVPVQVMLNGEFYGLSGPFGVPVVLTTNGWRTVMPVALTPDEEALLHQASQVINRHVAVALPYAKPSLTSV
jgi:malate dehydrogenase